MTDKGLPFLSAAETALAVREKRVSPVEVAEAYLARIDRLTPQLNAYITICREQALTEAMEAERVLMAGGSIGPLFGVPVAVKDQFRTAGVLTTHGSKVYKDYIPDYDASAIAGLKQSGAIIMGKLNMAEMALGGTRQPPWGTPRNPWDLARNPGESSSGSGVAVAAHLCAASLGEDTGGSGRTPAAYCGIVGLRPTFTRVSRYGMFPACWYMDAAAPMTKTVEDCAIMLGAIAGYDHNDPVTSRRPVPDYTKCLTGEIRGVRIGLIKELHESEFMDIEVKESVDRAVELLETLGAEVQTVSIPLIMLAGALHVGIIDTEAAGALDEILRTNPMELDRANRTRLQSAALLPTKLLDRAMKARVLLRRQFLEALNRVDVLVSATSCYQPPKYVEDTAEFQNEEDVRRRMYARRCYVGSYSLAALPAMSIPCGFTRGNLPVGMQLGARPFAEEMIMRVAYAYEQATPWHKHCAPSACL